MRYYYDTSALCRFYHPEPGSAEVIALVNEAGASHFVSWLTLTEATSAFAMKVRTGDITPSDYGQLCKLLQADVVARRFEVTRVLRRHFTAAERLIATYGLSQRLRTLDALHAAIALDLVREGHVDCLVTADGNLEGVATKEGIAVRNPLATAP